MGPGSVRAGTRPTGRRETEDGLEGGAAVGGVEEHLDPGEGEPLGLEAANGAETGQVVLVVPADPPGELRVGEQPPRLVARGVRVLSPVSWAAPSIRTPSDSAID